MKKHTFMTWLQGSFFGFAVGFSGIACLVTGFSLPVNLWMVALWCALAAVTVSFCCGRRLGFVVWGILALSVGYLWYTGLLAESLESFLYYLSQVYQDAFGWKVISWSGRSEELLRETLPPMFVLWGCLVTAVTAWSVTKGQSATPVFLAAIPMPLMCLIVERSHPGTLWLWLLFYGLIMVLITASVRFDDEKRGNRLTLFTAIPVALAVVILFAAVPKDAYTGQARAEAWSDALLSDSLLRQKWDALMGQNQSPDYSAQVRKVSLVSLGARTLSDDSVFSVTAEYNGTLYLRSSALDIYDGKNWVSSEDGTTLPWPEESRLGQTGEVVISTRYAHAMLYLPYYVVSLDLNGTARGVQNEKRLTYYSVTCAMPPEESYFSQLYPDETSSPHAVSIEFGSQCTELPKQTVAWAKPLADEITKGLGNCYHKAQAIGNYVRNSAVYDLNPKQMESGETDFARWFIKESDSGYCVHFATATAVLLKAAGIPARYVSGYCVTVEEGKPTAVRESDAHAWVEYWLPGYGWIPLETTPAALPPTQQQTPAGEGKTDTSISLSIPEGVWIGVVIALPVGLLAQWRIRLRRKTRCLKKGDHKEKVISRYHRLEELHKLLREPIQPAVTEVAEKAKFSPHPMVEADVAVLDSAIDSAKGKLRRHNLWKKLYYRLFLAEL